MFAKASHQDRFSSQRFSVGIWLFGVAICTMFSILSFRLIEMQLIQGSEYRAKADQNRFFTRYLPASRGVFFDRTGKVLVRNKPLYKKATPETAGKPYPKFIQIHEQEALTGIVEDQRNIVLDQQREYLYGESLSLLLGFIGEATKEELTAYKEFYLGESIGKFGLEKTYQSKLAGKTGEEVYEMDAMGNLLRVVNKKSAISGVDVQLTIDASLSAKAYELLDGKKGAIVASDPRTGEILALVSSPAFDPTKIQESLSNPNSPFLNRAISGTYPPGSTFKLMTALSGLAHNAINIDTKVIDEGVLKVGEFSFGNWYFSQYGRTEGEVDLVKALQRSNDIFFYKVAEWVGPEKLAETARQFHFGVINGIELNGEAAGLIPDPAWKEQTKGEKWFLGNTYHMGIGQGDVLATPLQINQATAAIANDSVWCKPKIVSSTQQECTELHISADDLALVRKGMEAACSEGGTAYPFFDHKPVAVRCKTGTAEFGPQDEKGRRKTHALFTMAAPAENPEIVITVVLEGTEEQKFLEGSKDAGPIAKKLLEEWFSKR